MSYQSDPNQSWGYPPSGGQSPGDPPAGGQPPGYQPYPNQPAGYEPYPNQPYANQPGQPVLAGWWYRVGATIIDGLIVGIPAGIISAAANSRPLSYALGSVIGLVYMTLLIGGGGRTVGMMAVGTRCLDAAGGTTIGYGRALLRWFVSVVLELTVIGFFIDILWPLWDDKNQTVHDKAASSVVVLTR